MKEDLNSIINSLIDIKNDEYFFVNKGQISYNLKDCLDNSSDKLLSFIYKMVIMLNSKINNKEKNYKNRKDIINFLYKRLPIDFEEFLYTLNKDDIKTFNEYKKNGYLSNYNVTLVNNGFMYGYKDNDKIKYIIPNEFMDIYNKKYNSEFQDSVNKEKIIDYLGMYLTINGIMDKNAFSNILINEYKINVTESEIDKIVKESNFKINNNKYYSLGNFGETKEQKDNLDELIKEKEKLSYKVLDEMSLRLYHIYYINAIKRLEGIIKKYDDPINMMINITSFSSILDGDFEFDNLPKRVNDKLNDFVNDNYNNLRFWNLNGRTIDELEIEEIESKYLLKKIPKKTKLKDLINSLDKNLKEELYDDYETNNIDNLCNKIIEGFKDNIKELNNTALLELSYANHEKWKFNVIDDSMIIFGQAFLYMEDNITKVVIPDELFDIIKSNVKVESDTEDAIMGYIALNGVIKKDKLQELLKNNHNIDLSIKEIDKIIKKNNLYIIDNYYSTEKDINDNMYKSLIRDKEKLNDYKKLEYDSLDNDDLLNDEIIDLIPESVGEEISGVVTTAIKFNLYNSNLVDFYIQENNIKISSKLKKELLSIINKYRNDISIWNYNGYTVNEYNKLTKRNKIGRNELCFCGSGLKYKKCHGK